MTDDERNELDAALRINRACIWCRREGTHSEGCLVAEALGVPTSPPIWAKNRREVEP